MCFLQKMEIERRITNVSKILRATTYLLTSPDRQSWNIVQKGMETKTLEVWQCEDYPILVAARIIAIRYREFLFYYILVNHQHKFVLTFFCFVFLRPSDRLILMGFILPSMRDSSLQLVHCSRLQHVSLSVVSYFSKRNVKFWVYLKKSIEPKICITRNHRCLHWTLLVGEVEKIPEPEVL